MADRKELKLDISELSPDKVADINKILAELMIQSAAPQVFSLHLKI